MFTSKPPTCAGRNARFTPERQGYQVLTPFGKLGYSQKYAAGTTVGEGALRNFAGAIDAANTTKGVFVTTAGFTRSATDYVAKSPKRIVLIDGEELARLMVVHEIGVRTRIRYAVKRIDEDYFAGEDL